MVLYLAVINVVVKTRTVYIRTLLNTRVGLQNKSSITMTTKLIIVIWSYLPSECWFLFCLSRCSFTSNNQLGVSSTHYVFVYYKLIENAMDIMHRYWYETILGLVYMNISPPPPMAYWVHYYANTKMYSGIDFYAHRRQEIETINVRWTWQVLPHELP